MNERTRTPLLEPKGRYRKPRCCQEREGERTRKLAVILSRLDIDREGQLSEERDGGTFGTGFLGVVAELTLLCRWY
jgi:hypothetical protein